MACDASNRVTQIKTQIQHAVEDLTRLQNALVEAEVFSEDAKRVYQEELSKNQIGNQA